MIGNKPWNNEPSSPLNEGSTSQKDATITLDNSISSKVVENDVSSSSQTDNITINSNTISNNDDVNTVSENNDNQISGNGEGGNWADQAQESSTNWQKPPDESNQVNDNLNSEEGSSNTNNNITAVPQNRNQYNNNRNRKNQNQNQFSVYVGNLSTPVSEEELKEFFSSQIKCQIAKVRLMFDRESDTQKNFAYVEFADTVSQENAIQLNGQIFRQQAIKINKPEDRFDYRQSRGRGRGRGRGGYYNNRGYRGHGNNSHNNNGGGNMQNGQQ